jgi:hypothetical protein
MQLYTVEISLSNANAILKYMDSIFISIASCKELFLVQTIKSAIANASHPENIYFGICNMVVDEEDFLTDPVFKLKNVNVIETKHISPLGTGIGRMLASLMHDRDHKFFLQVDAHTIFVKGWDTIIKNQYEELLGICEKPIISCGPKQWDHDENGNFFIFENPKNFINIESLVVKTKNPTLVYQSADGSRGMNPAKKYSDTPGVVKPITADWEDEENFKEHGLIHAAFVFFKFSFLNELITDPFDPWHGDQTNISFRAGTRGYRMFTVKDATLFTKDKCFSDGTLRYKDDWREASKDSTVWSYHVKNSNIRLNKMLAAEELGFWGAPNKESIHAYKPLSSND